MSSSARASWIALTALASLLISSGASLASPRGDAKPSTGSLVLNATTLGAEVFIDGEQVGVTPLAAPLPLPEGEHTIKVSKPGYAPLIDVLRIVKRKPTKFDVELTPVAGILRLRSNVEKSRVFVDGKFVGEAPLVTELPVGAVAIQVSHGGYKDFFKNVEAVAGQEIPLDITLEELPPDINPYIVKAPPPPKWYQKWWVWTVGLVGVGVVVTAVTVPIVLTQRDPIKQFNPNYTFTVNTNGP